MFCHLHVHTEYSLLDGFGNAKNYVKRAKELGHQYLACTDHASIDGLIKFQKECKKNDISPILGCEAYIVENADQKTKGDDRGHVTLLVKNMIGFKNLCQMLTFANLDGFYYRPRIDFDLLYEHCEGLIILTGCAKSFLTKTGASEFLYDLRGKIKDDIYLEVMPHELEEQKAINNLCKKILLDYPDMKLVATNDCHYINKDDFTTHEVLLAMQTKAKWTDPGRFRFKVNGLYLRSRQEMVEAFYKQGILNGAEVDKALDTTIEIAGKCKDFMIKKQGIFLPDVPGYVGLNPDAHIQMLAEKALAGLKLDGNKVYTDRLQEECDMIRSKKFAEYFMIVWELVNWCKQNNIMIGPGRGSAAGSLLAYLLGITAIDPIKFNLLFSRFIAEDRVDFPDIDIDFEDSKRHLVRGHLEQLYGRNNISSISTFLSMQGRAVIRDVARVFDINTADVDRFAKSIGFEDEENIIEKSVAKTEEGKWFNNKYPEIVRHAIKLEGQLKAGGQHAAGVIISGEDLTKGGKGNLVTRSSSIVSNWDMEDSEYVGLMKLDVLGLNTLSVLSEAKRLIDKNYNMNLKFDDIPIDDKEVYKDVAAGHTIGIFQLAGWATTKMAKEIQADNFAHLSDVIALSRPGPFDSGQTTLYIERKRGGKWKKKHPIYEKITEKTYGIVVYQEQIMEVINKVGGLSYSTADKIRKVISKKRDAREFKPFRDSFIAGCLEQKTFSKQEAEDFWEELQKHASYSFNLSHSVSYATIGLWTAYIKHYYPTEFICAILTYGADSKKEEIMNEAYRLGLELVLPRVGTSDAFKWVAKDNRLYCPFIEIKGIGEKSAEQCMVVRAKQNDGIFNAKPKEGGKIEKLLAEIGAFGEEPTGDVSKYFSFVIRKPNKNKMYPALVQKLGFTPHESDMDSYLTLDLSPRYAMQLIKESSFVGSDFGDFMSKLEECKNCQLGAETEFGAVPPSKGKYNIMIVGEAPGENEDEKGKGFIGRAGEVLWEELKKHELNRDDFHVTNCCKCFPKVSKTPNKMQIEKCRAWLQWEIDDLNPCLILAFGNVSLESFIGKTTGITEMSGKTEWDEISKAWICWCIHPSAILHNPNNRKYFEAGIRNFSEKITLLGDLK